MISDRCSDTNRKVLVKGVGENLLPTAQAWGTLAAGLSGSGSTHRTPSYRRALRSQARSGPGHAAPGSILWRQDEPQDRRDAW
jgi:hypothetical protein